MPHLGGCSAVLESSGAPRARWAMGSRKICESQYIRIGFAIRTYSASGV